MTEFNYCYHCGNKLKTVEELHGDPQYYCNNCGTRLKFYGPHDQTGRWMDNLTPDEERIVDAIEREIDAGHVISHNQLFEQFSISERRWNIEYFDSEFYKQLDRLKLPDRQKFQSCVKALANRKNPATHKDVKQLTGKRKTYRLRVSCDVRAIFRLHSHQGRQHIRFVLIGKQDHIYDLYKQKVSTSIVEADKYCSLCGHQIHEQNLRAWIDELDPESEEEKVLEEIEKEIDAGLYFNHERLFGKPLSLKEQPLRWGIKYGTNWNDRIQFKQLYIQDQKRFLVYVEELALIENPLEHSAVKQLTNRPESYRLRISPFVRVIFTLQRSGDKPHIRFLKSGKKGDDSDTINGKLWQEFSNFDYCLKCGEIYRTEDHSWADVLEPGLAELLQDISTEARKNPEMFRPLEELKSCLREEEEEEDKARNSAS